MRNIRRKNAKRSFDPCKRASDDGRTGDQEPIEIVVAGQYYFRNGSHYLRYEELLDETAEPTINYIKMSEKGLEVSKRVW